MGALIDSPPRALRPSWLAEEFPAGPRPVRGLLGGPDGPHDCRGGSTGDDSWQRDTRFPLACWSRQPCDLSAFSTDRRTLRSSSKPRRRNRRWRISAPRSAPASACWCPSRQPASSGASGPCAHSSGCGGMDAISSFVGTTASGKRRSPPPLLMAVAGVHRRVPDLNEPFGQCPLRLRLRRPQPGAHRHGAGTGSWDWAAFRRAFDRPPPQPLQERAPSRRTAVVRKVSGRTGLPNPTTLN